MIIAEFTLNGWAVTAFDSYGLSFTRTWECKTFRDMLSYASKLYEESDVEFFNNNFILKIGGLNINPSETVDVMHLSGALNRCVVDLSDEYKVIEAVLMYGDMPL
jgi:hypothetical protein